MEFTGETSTKTFDRFDAHRDRPMLQSGMIP